MSPQKETVQDILKRKIQESKEVKVPKRKLSLIEKRQIIQKETVLAEIKNIPILLIVCKKANISRATVYRWFQTDFKFRKEYEKSRIQGTESINDLAKACIITKIKEGCFKSSAFWLTHCDKDFVENKKFIESPEKAELTIEQQAGMAERLRLWKKVNIEE